jgi:molybdate transport system substrate-binding protein
MKVMDRARARETVRVFAATSLKDALNDIAAKFTGATGIKEGSFSALHRPWREIEEGASVDLFASADIDWMDYLAQGNLIKPRTRVNLLSNRLVIVAPKNSPASSLTTSQVIFLRKAGTRDRKPFAAHTG